MSTPLRILMLHGYTQSGPLFHAKTRALEKTLLKAFKPRPVQLVYPTAPIHLSPSDIPTFISSRDRSADEPDAQRADASRDPDESFGWWVRGGSAEPFVYEGIEKGLDALAAVLKEQGPFDGVLGFSQGGALAGMVASLLEPGRRKAFEEASVKGGMAWPASFEKVHAPLRFAVSYSGFGAIVQGPYRAFYEPKIATPMLHFLGSVDTVVEEYRTMRLVDACVEGKGKDGERLHIHPGGHFLPASQKPVVNALITFIKESMGEDYGSNGMSKENEKAEDMDMPF